MKVYWLKEKTKDFKIGYSQKEILENFCGNYDSVYFEWNSSPKSFYSIIDITEELEDEIINFINNDLNIFEFKTTTRSNESAAKQEFSRLTYIENYQPFCIDSNIDKVKLICEINKKYRTCLSVDDFK